MLQQIPGLHVAARLSAFSFKGKNATAQEIGEKLGVAHLVEGSVRKSGRSVRITVRLTRAATGEQLWSESYTRNVKDMFAVQSELAQTVVEQLRGPARRRSGRFHESGAQGAGGGGRERRNEERGRLPALSSGDVLPEPVLAGHRSPGGGLPAARRRPGSEFRARVGGVVPIGLGARWICRDQARRRRRIRAGAPGSGPRARIAAGACGGPSRPIDRANVVRLRLEGSRRIVASCREGRRDRPRRPRGRRERRLYVRANRKGRRARWPGGLARSRECRNADRARFFVGGRRPLRGCNCGVPASDRIEPDHGLGVRRRGHDVVARGAIRRGAARGGAGIRTSGRDCACRRRHCGG